MLVSVLSVWAATQSAPVALADSPMVLNEVVEVESATADQLYAAGQQWFATTYRSAQDVVQLADREDHIIVGRGSINYTAPSVKMSCFTGTISYTVKLETKDGRYRLSLSGFEHRQKPGNSPTCRLGLLTTADEFKSTGLGKGAYNDAWDGVRLRADLEAKRIAGSVRGALAKPAETVPREEDW